MSGGFGGREDGELVVDDLRGNRDGGGGGGRGGLAQDVCQRLLGVTQLLTEQV